MPLIDARKLEEFAIALLRAGGATESEAEIVGRSLVESNLRGFDSHGVMRIPYYIQSLANDETESNVELTILREAPSYVVADANWGFGRVQCGRLVDMLVERARQHGVAVGTLVKSSHIGRLGEYCEIGAAANQLSIIMANTHGYAKRVAPPGGKSPRLGTNPIAFGAPHPDGPLVLDFSTSVTAEGKVRVHKIAGEHCPEGWLLDADGRPTTNPNVLYATPPGSILPMGGSQPYKGFGLALMIELFAGAFSGGVCSREEPITQNGNCVFLMFADPEHFGGAAHYEHEVVQLSKYIRECPRAEGCEEILLPGDPERNLRKKRLAEGIPLDDENLGQLMELAQLLTVPPPKW